MGRFFRLVGNIPNPAATIWPMLCFPHVWLAPEAVVEISQDPGPLEIVICLSHEVEQEMRRNNCCFVGRNSPRGLPID
jgi:hypothetical protein